MGQPGMAYCFLAHLGSKVYHLSALLYEIYVLAFYGVSLINNIEYIASLTFGLGRVGGDAIEDVDEDEEERDEECHAARDDVGRHHEADPRYHNKQS